MVEKFVVNSGVRRLIHAEFLAQPEVEAASSTEPLPLGDGQIYSLW